MELGKAADKVGHLKLKGDMTLAKLKTEDTANTITVASGKTLIVKELTGDNLYAEVSGDLKLTLADGKMGTLDKDVHGKVEFVGTKPNGATLALAKGVKVISVDFTAAAPAADKLKLALKGKNEIGTLTFANTTAGLNILPVLIFVGILGNVAGDAAPIATAG